MIAFLVWPLLVVAAYSFQIRSMTRRVHLDSHYVTYAAAPDAPPLVQAVERNSFITPVWIPEAANRSVLSTPPRLPKRVALTVNDKHEWASENVRTSPYVAFSPSTYPPFVPPDQPTDQPIPFDQIYDRNKDEYEARLKSSSISAIERRDIEAWKSASRQRKAHDAS